MFPTCGALLVRFVVGNRALCELAHPVTSHARTRVKVCGITNLDDALAAVASGADALGFIFWPHSSRYISATKATEICAEIPPFVTRVGVLVDPTRHELDGLMRQVALDIFQFHGNETADFCNSQPHAYYKALRMSADMDVVAAAKQYDSSRGLLVDSYVPDVPGGSGRTFEWRQLPKNHIKPIILAGGLGPGNVQQAIRLVRPYAVDVSSGVEQMKGKKDPSRLREFFDAVRSVDAEQQHDPAH